MKLVSHGVRVHGHFISPGERCVLAKMRLACTCVSVCARISTVLCCCKGQLEARLQSALMTMAHTAPVLAKLFFFFNKCMGKYEGTETVAAICMHAQTHTYMHIHRGEGGNNMSTNRQTTARRHLPAPPVLLLLLSNMF